MGEGPQAPLFFSYRNTYVLHKVSEKNTNALRGGIKGRIATSSWIKMY